MISGFIFILDNHFPHALENRENYLAIISLVAILVLLIIRMFNGKVNINVVLKQVVAWMSIFVIIIICYSYRYELEGVYYNIINNMIPSRGQQNQDGSITFRESVSGHFLIDAEVNNQKISFLLDTGASKITLSKKDAEKLGFDLQKLHYNIRMNTANGVNLAAYVRLNELRVGSIIMKDIDAYVNKNGLSSSLLGMNFLNRLDRYEVRKGEITFYERH